VAPFASQVRPTGKAELAGVGRSLLERPERLETVLAKGAQVGPFGAQTRLSRLPDI